MVDSRHDYIIVGKITRPYGIKGWLHIHSYTEPPENILQFQPVYLNQSKQWKEHKIIQGRRHGKGVVAQFEQVQDRNQAELMHGTEIAVLRAQLPDTQENEYYWADLIGCKVVTEDGVELGIIQDFMETGANDVLVIKGERERLLPFVWDECIQEIDLEGRLVRVRWDPEF